MYFFYKQGKVPNMPTLTEGYTIIKKRPKPYVEGMHSLQIGWKRYVYFIIMTFLCGGFSRVFEEYDIVKNGIILSKAVLISKVPIYKFLPSNGVHLCYCETISEARGKGLYPLLLSYIQNVYKKYDLYMIVDESNLPSIKGIEKAGFVRYAKGEKMANGVFVELKKSN